MPRLLIIISSTRPGRIGDAVAAWFEGRARQDGRFEVEVADLARLDLPLLNEPHHPRLRQYTHDHTRAWSAIVERTDAVALVCAEYNYGYTAPLKNALDYLHHEWRHKPIGFVSYGGVAAGTRAVQQLKQIVTALAMVPAVASVNIPFVQQFLTEDRTIAANAVMEQAADAMLEELLALSGALAPLRVG